MVVWRAVVLHFSAWMDDGDPVRRTREEPPCRSATSKGHGSAKAAVQGNDDFYGASGWPVLRAVLPRKTLLISPSQVQK